MYLQLIQEAGFWEGLENVAQDKNVDWSTLKMGFEEQIGLDPKDLYLLQLYAYYAWMRSDKTATRRAFGLFDNNPHPSVWDSVAQFDKAKHWAEK